MVEEGRRAVYRVIGAVLLHLEAAVAEELKVIIKVAARYSHLVAEFVYGVSVVLGEQQQQVELALKFVVAHFC